MSIVPPPPPRFPRDWLRGARPYWAKAKLEANVGFMPQSYHAVLLEERFPPGKPAPERTYFELVRSEREFVNYEGLFLIEPAHFPKVTVFSESGADPTNDVKWTFESGVIAFTLPEYDGNVHTFVEKAHSTQQGDHARFHFEWQVRARVAFGAHFLRYYLRPCSEEFRAANPPS